MFRKFTSKMLIDKIVASEFDVSNNDRQTMNL